MNEEGEAHAAGADAHDEEEDEEDEVRIGDNNLPRRF